MKRSTGFLYKLILITYLIMIKACILDLNGTVYAGMDAIE